MSSHAPEMHQVEEPINGWMDDMSDLRLSIYMLTLAGLVGGVFLLIYGGLPT